MCDECHELLETLKGQYDGIVALQRQLMQHQISSLPKYLTQARQYLASATTLNFNLHTQSQVAYRVTCFIANVTSTATLQIQERTWPINGFLVQYLGPDGLVIRPEDLVQLTQATQGVMSLEFFGQELADRGKRW